MAHTHLKYRNIMSSRPLPTVWNSAAYKFSSDLKKSYNPDTPESIFSLHCGLKNPMQTQLPIKRIIME